MNVHSLVLKWDFRGDCDFRRIIPIIIAAYSGKSQTTKNKSIQLGLFLLLLRTDNHIGSVIHCLQEFQDDITQHVYSILDNEVGVLANRHKIYDFVNDIATKGRNGMEESHFASCSIGFQYVFVLSV